MTGKDTKPRRKDATGPGSATATALTYRPDPTDVVERVRRLAESLCGTAERWLTCRP